MYSAIVINHNGAGYIGRCLDALLAQDPAPDQVVVVDSGSTDGSPELVTDSYPAVQLVRADGNVGPAAARNLGAEHAAHGDLLFLDNDAILEPGCVAALQRHRQAHPDAGMVQVRSLCGDDPTKVHYDGADLHVLGTLVLRNWYRPLTEAEDPAGPVGAGIALCFWMPADIYRAVGGFDPAMFFFYEDTEFSYRVRMHGHGIHLCPAARVLHLGGTAGLSMRGEGAHYPARRTFLHSRNRPYMLLVCMRWRTLLLTLPIHLLYDLVYGAFSVTLGHGWAFLKGKLAWCAMVPRALRMRRRAQRGRTVPDRDLLVAIPMTYNPGLASRGFKARLSRVLDRCYGGWWALVRRACG